MKKTLILAEKPSVARDIAKVLPDRFVSRSGYVESDQYVVTWAIGHLLTLAEPEDYNRDLKKWKIEHLPIMPGTFKLRPGGHAEEQLRVIKKLLKRSDVGVVVNGCDAGREGELIFRWIYAWSGCRKPVRRLWLSETTPRSVRQAMENLRPGSDYDFLAAAAQVRAQADWVVGINATRAFTIAQKTLLSIGRVQTPTLALVVAREQEIRAFTARDYWELWTTFRTDAGETYQGKWFSADQDTFDNREDAERIKAEVDATGAGVVTSVESQDVNESAPNLYNLTDLQKDANRLYGLSAEDTLAAAQNLYEAHLITYPRTESRHLTESLGATVDERIAALGAVHEYAGIVRQVRSKEIPARYLDDARVDDHHALIPTDVPPNPAVLGENEVHVYDLVARRFLATFFPDARFRETTAITEVGEHNFKSKGRIELQRGWRVVYDDGDVEEQEAAVAHRELPDMAEDQEVLVVGSKAAHKKTQPPRRYTEGTLLGAMENAGRFVDDRELKRRLRAVGGIGTAATRAAIITRLIKVGYLSLRGKQLVPTAKAEILISLVPELLRSPELTARWEETLHAIENRRGSPKRFMDGIIREVQALVQQAESQEPAPELEPFRTDWARKKRPGKPVKKHASGMR
ncbi:MAG: DNA topoisomerase III [Desulforudis sp.]|nr:MAG: DNA topoisomerase III [Desulforudis sp.]